MDNDSTPDPPRRWSRFTDDPEIAALLDFEPVSRKCIRHDGWDEDIQRGFIVALAAVGSPWRAAQAVGRTESGAYKVRTSAGAEFFAAAWDGALALYHRRNPRSLPRGRPSRGEILAGSGRAWRSAAAPSAPAPEDPEAEERAKEEAFDLILEKYILKLGMEREARLGGRIVEADFYVRQPTWLEVALDLGGRGHKLLMQLRRGGLHAGEIVATPMSVLLDRARRLYWQEEGGPERPPPPPLGHHDGELSAGPPLECQHDAERDGPYREWPARRDEAAALAAEAQRAWEEKARAEAEEWAARVEGAGGADEPEARP